MTMLSPVAMLGWIGAVLLFLLALRTWSDGRTARRRARMGLAGMMLAMGAALYFLNTLPGPTSGWAAK